MLITKGKISGIYIIELKPFIDERGFFMRTYDEKEFMRIWEDGKRREREEGKGEWEDGKRREREEGKGEWEDGKRREREDEGKGEWEDGKRSERDYEERSKWEDEGMGKWVQDNHSKSFKKGIIRGLHFQLPPYAETKLVRCIRGEIQDVFVDLRNNSETFGKWDSVILSEDNFKCLLIPRGFAHGFCTLTDNCEVLYKVDNYYSPEHERGLIWNDPDIGIKWQVENPILSEKDKKNKTLKELMREWGYEGMRI